MKAGGAGAIEAVVAALRAHGANAAVQEQGCRALVNLCSNADNRVKAGGAGAIEAVVAALRAHGANAAVQEFGCLALVYICWTRSELRARARAAGAVPALEAAVAAFKQGPVVEMAQQALSKIKQ